MLRNSDFREYMVARRVELRIPKDQLAKDMGITYGWLDNFERGINTASAAFVARLCKHLKVSFDELCKEFAPLNNDENPMVKI